MFPLDILVQLDLLASLTLRVVKVLLALLVPLVLLALQVQVVAAMTLFIKGTSTELTSLTHHFLLHPRIMKLILLQNSSMTQIKTPLTPEDSKKNPACT